MGDVERFVERLLDDGVRPDLVALTGDYADDLDQLEPMLRAVAALRPRLGTYACLGNHEHHLDPARVRRTFARSDAVLLETEGVHVPGTRLFVAGTGDVMGGEPDAFYRREVERAVRDAGSADTVLLLAHRPDAFFAARDRGVGLTLSGHTHGGQIGWAGRSAVEGALGRAMWGIYGDARARLYLTSGFGHWFRFRLGCPTEAPLLLLTPGT